MALRLTPENLPAAYEYLRACEPFSAWKLPHADDLEFRVTRHKDRFGHFDDKDGKKKFPDISISEVHVKTTATLMETMSHELIHLKDYLDGKPISHGVAFKRRAARVCKAHGFDPKVF